MSGQLLIIDDDRATHELINAHLADTHTQCISAWSGIEGIQCAVESKPTAILLDMDMPCMNGMEVCAKLKADPQTRAIPIMFLTGDGTMRSKVQGIDMGAVDYVTKPFDPFELRARVRSVFRMANDIASMHAQAGVDEATGLWNRAFIARQIENVVAASARNKQMVSCCFLSIDRFDTLASKMGQPGGDDLIREAAEAITNTVRLEDIVCRWDLRVLAVLGFVADVERAKLLADRLCSSVGQIGLRSFTEPEAVTSSVGLATAHASNGPLILRTAEKALAQAAVDGNRIVMLSADISDWERADGSDA